MGLGPPMEPVDSFTMEASLMESVHSFTMAMEAPLMEYVDLFTMEAPAGQANSPI